MSEKIMNFTPKNIRQIGVTVPNDKIYIEDYVMTYIKQLSDVINDDNRILMFVGYKQSEGGVDYSCISGVVELVGEVEYNGYMDLLIKDNLNKLTRTKEDYYGDLDFVGLCVITRNEWINFADDLYCYFQNGMMGDILLVRDEVNEEQVFRYRNTNFIKQRGYYIYYDRNESMQNYMLCMKDGKSIEYGYSPSEIIDKNVDEKIRSFSIPKNAVYTEKGMSYRNYKSSIENKWKYALASVLAIAVLIVGVIKVDKLEEITKEKASQLVDKTTEVINNDSDKLEVETVVSELVIDEEQVKEAAIQENAMVESEEEKQEEKQEDKEKEATIDENNNKSINDNEKDIRKTTDGGNDGNVEASANAIKEVVQYYVVRKGDALVDISRRMYGTHKKVYIIKKANGIEDEDKIFIGQRLLIP